MFLLSILLLFFLYLGLKFVCRWSRHRHTETLNRWLSKIEHGKEKQLSQVDIWLPLDLWRWQLDKLRRDLEQRGYRSVFEDPLFERLTIYI